MRACTIVGGVKPFPQHAEYCWVLANVRDRGRVVTAGVRDLVGAELTSRLDADVDGLAFGLPQPRTVAAGGGLLVWEGRLAQRRYERAWDSQAGQQLDQAVCPVFEGRWRPLTTVELVAATWCEPYSSIQIVWEKKRELHLERLVTRRLT